MSSITNHIKVKDQIACVEIDLYGTVSEQIGDVVVYKKNNQPYALKVIHRIQEQTMSQHYYLLRTLREERYKQPHNVYLWPHYRIPIHDDIMQFITPFSKPEILQYETDNIKQCIQGNMQWTELISHINDHEYSKELLLFYVDY